MSTYINTELARWTSSSMNQSGNRPDTPRAAYVRELRAHAPSTRLCGILRLFVAAPDLRPPGSSHYWTCTFQLHHARSLPHARGLTLDASSVFSYWRKRLSPNPCQIAFLIIRAAGGARRCERTEIANRFRIGPVVGRLLEAATGPILNRLAISVILQRAAPRRAIQILQHFISEMPVSTAQRERPFRQ